MKIKQYQEVYKILNSDISELDKAYHYYAIMHNQEYNGDLPINTILKFYKSSTLNNKKRGLVPWYRIGFKIHKLNLNITHNTASDNMSVIAFCANEDSMVENLHKILATMTKRSQSQRKSGAYFDKLANSIREKVDWRVAYNLSLFFLKNYNEDKILKKLTQNLNNVNTRLKKLQKAT